MTFKSVDTQWELISRGAEEIIPENDLKSKLEKSKFKKIQFSKKLSFMRIKNC